MSEQHLLVVFPHPDDEVFAIGTMIHYLKQGIPVTYVCATLGEMGRNMGNPPFANRETLSLIRREELDKACEIIGVTHLRRLGLRDKTLEFESRDTLVKPLYTIMKQLSPSDVITFYPGYSVHPDHDACGAAVIEAVDGLPQEARPTVLCAAVPHDKLQELGKPDVVHDVSDVLQQKVMALSAHRTQVEGGRSGIGDKLARMDKEAKRFLSTEPFWTYSFQNPKVDTTTWFPKE